jgi:hypothetical protein
MQSLQFHSPGWKRRRNKISLGAGLQPLAAFFCGGVSWSLAPYGHRNCLLASARDSRNNNTQIDNKQAFYPTCFRVLSFHRCYAFPIVQPAFWHTFIPSTLLLADSDMVGCLDSRRNDPKATICRDTEIAVGWNS